MSHIGIFGGTFDPVHNGHLITVQQVYEKRRLDKVILIPSYVSPFKTDIQTASSGNRIKMVELAIENLPAFECSDFEIRNKGISYTIKTLEHFKEEYDKIDLIIGFDNILSFHKWKNPDAIFDLADVIVMKREVDEYPKNRNEFMDKAIYINTPLVNISATDIRGKVANGLPIDNLVPEKVKDYILANKLYRPSTL